MEPILEIKGVTKRYGRQLALRDVSLSLPRGIVGLLGPNGSGKSTFIKSLLGLVRVDSGVGRVLDFQWPAQVRVLRDHVGYLPEDDCYIESLQGIESIQMMARLSGLHCSSISLKRSSSSPPIAMLSRFDCRANHGFNRCEEIPAQSDWY